MPNFDGTGPAGAGALTGRGGGSCATQRGRGILGGCGRRRGQGFGAGQGVRNEMGQGFCFREISLEEREKMLEEELVAVQEARKEAEKKD